MNETLPSEAIKPSARWSRRRILVLVIMFAGVFGLTISVWQYRSIQQQFKVEKEAVENLLAHNLANASKPKALYSDWLVSTLQWFGWRGEPPYYIRKMYFCMLEPPDEVTLPPSLLSQEQRKENGYTPRSFSDQDLTDLANLTALEQLTLTDGDLTTETMEIISKMDSLRELNLHNLNSLTPGSLEMLVKLKRLNFFDLNGVALFTSDDLRAIMQCRHLEELRLGPFEVIEVKDLGALSALNGLKRLSLFGDWLGQELFDSLPVFVNLEYLHLHGVNITELPSGIDKKFPQLQYLKLFNTRVTDQMLQQLSQFSHLNTLYIVQGNETDPDKTLSITDDGIFHLVKLQELERLFLFSTSLTEKSLKVIGTMPGLKEIKMSTPLVSKEKVEEFNDIHPGYLHNFGGNDFSAPMPY